MTHFSFKIQVSFTLFSISVCLCLVGCGIGASRVKAPEWDPTELVNRAFEALDTNGDAELDDAELASAPGLKSGSKYIDTNADGKISRSELEERIKLYKDGRVALKQVTFRVLFKGRPLEDGNVKLVPEPFLGELCQTGTGMIFDDGTTNPSIPGEKIPSMQLGYYRIEVTSDNKKIPAKYNTETTLGLEVSPISDDADSYSVQTFDLK